MKRFLNVGAGSKKIPVPSRYDGWQQEMLDVDAKSGADVIMDARQIAERMDPGLYDAVYCSHALEHFYAHETQLVLRGFHKVLKDDGFAEIRVPDLNLVFKEIAARNLGLEDVLYLTAARQTPISVRDVIYGFGPQIAKSGDYYFAHKTGFTPKLLVKELHAAGFVAVVTGVQARFEVTAFAFKQAVTVQHAEQLVGHKLM
jgi:hypothetical protein